MINTSYITYAKHDKNIKGLTMGSVFSAGYDVYALEDTWIYPFKVTKVKLNVSIELQEGTFGLVTSRSGLSTKGIVCVPGIIDSDYRGQVCALMYRIGLLPKKIKKGERIAQLISIKYNVCTTSEVEINELTKTDRGTNGFGSTGIE